MILEENVLRQKVTTDIATKGGQYDVVTIGAYETPIWGKKGWLTSLDDFKDYDYDDLLAPVKAGLTVDGKLYAVPFYAESSFTMYRKDLFEKAGLTMPVLDARVDADGAFVGTDNHVSMNLMVDYLLRSGAPPSYFDMPAVNQNATERRQAYELSMLEREAQPVIFDVPSLDWDFERLAYQEATRLFKTDAPVGGTILCANDRVAFGVMAAACQIGISVGRLADLRIAGHDDHPLSQYACPSLTTVAQDVDRLATLSLERLMQGIAEGANKNSTDRLEARLIMRNSA